jgi:hypothetical protein
MSIKKDTSRLSISLGSWTSPFRFDVRTVVEVGFADFGTCGNLSCCTCHIAMLDHLVEASHFPLIITLRGMPGRTIVPRSQLEFSWNDRQAK